MRWVLKFADNFSDKTIIKGRSGLHFIITKFDFDGGYNIYLYISPWMCGMPISSELDFFYVVCRLLKYLSKFYLSMNNKQKWINYIMGHLYFVLISLQSFSFIYEWCWVSNSIFIFVLFFSLMSSTRCLGVPYGTASILDTKVFIGLISDLCA